MKDFKNILEKNSVKSDQSWKENAKYRRDNKWLLYSSEIALRILALIENDEELNQTKLANALNVSRQQISKIIKGKENLTLETIYKLSQALQFELITFPPYADTYSLGPAHITIPNKEGIDYGSLIPLKVVSEEKSANTQEKSWGTTIIEESKLIA